MTKIQNITRFSIRGMDSIQPLPNSTQSKGKCLVKFIPDRYPYFFCKYQRLFFHQCCIFITTIDSNELIALHSEYTAICLGIENLFTGTAHTDFHVFPCCRICIFIVSVNLDEQHHKTISLQTNIKCLRFMPQSFLCFLALKNLSQKHLPKERPCRVDFLLFSVRIIPFFGCFFDFFQ